MLAGFVKYQLRSSFSHHLEISGYRSNAIQDDLLQRCFIIGYYTNLLSYLELLIDNFFDQCYEVVFHEVNIYFACADRFRLDAVYHLEVKSILITKFPVSKLNTCNKCFLRNANNAKPINAAPITIKSNL